MSRTRVSADLIRACRCWFEFAPHYEGPLKGQSCNSHRPPRSLFRHNQYWKPFVQFVRWSLDLWRPGVVSLAKVLNPFGALMRICTFFPARVLRMSHNHGTILTNLSELFPLFLLLLRQRQYSNLSSLVFPSHASKVWEFGVRLGVFLRYIVWGFLRDVNVIPLGCGKDKFRWRGSPLIPILN